MTKPTWNARAGKVLSSSDKEDLLCTELNARPDILNLRCTKLAIAAISHRVQEGFDSGGIRAK